MCCFSGDVRYVSGTRIFARARRSWLPFGGSPQLLVYSMTVEAAADLAMILPLPVPPGSRESAVRFIDLSGYPKFFDDLNEAFPVHRPATIQHGGMVAGFAPPLRVHDVGAFEASFVPHAADFERLDERFRLPRDLWASIPEYRDWGFAVFKLKDLSVGRRKEIHPMAFDFPRRDSSRLFFPTLHVHDRQIHPTAAFSHTLYAQHPRDPSRPAGWQRSERALGEFVDAGRARGTIDGRSPVHRLSLFGTLPNRDTFVA